MNGPVRSGNELSQTDALGTRPVGPLLWQACSQTTVSVSVYGVYALTNAWFVGHGVGPGAMAAVNLAAPVLLVLGAVSGTVGTGGASLVSRRLGAGDPAGAARAAGNALVLFWLTASVITVAGLLGLDPLVGALGADAATRDDTRAYAMVLLAGALLTTGFTAVVRAEGRIRFATWQWVIGVVIQVTLDPLLIFGLHLGVRGAALGTIAGTAASAGMSLWFFFVQRDRPYRIRRADLRPHAPTVRALLGVGAPSLLAGLGTTLLAVLVNNLLGGVAGAVALAAYAVCVRLQTFVFMPQLGISQGLQPIVGFNAGRGQPARVRRARVLALRASLTYGTVAALVLIVVAGPLIRIFVDDPVITPVAVRALRIVALGVAVAGVAPLVSAYFQSLGRTRPSYLISVGSLLLIKVPLLLALSHTGTTGIWLSLALGELVTATAALLLLRLS
ncbi:MATE family efflux transporter [Actinoplanes awajinensis subsp. mycoplanecinus]|uniref:MATE family efflux transporter n=1 Tax=Actinoplanes awajinensis subsp. mycoplanecinus TaxID=135947 RepID=A0A117MMG3_9ACTN|nr:MATE family efflux transporter [Actinoplanes awajinensis subsp. mycoplanecinus]